MTLLAWLRVIEQIYRSAFTRRSVVGLLVVLGIASVGHFIACANFSQLKICPYAADVRLMIADLRAF